MFSRKRLTLGDGLLIAFFAFATFALTLLPQTNLLWHGIITQGVIVGEDTVSCGKSGERNTFSVQFTDHTGQVYIRAISQCEYLGFTASPGDSVTIVYLPDDPAVIAPPDRLLTNVQGFLICTILSGLTTLILLPLWIRKRIRMASLQDQPEQNTTVADDAKDQAGPEDYRPISDRDIIGGSTPGEP